MDAFKKLGRKVKFKKSGELKSINLEGIEDAESFIVHLKGKTTLKDLLLENTQVTDTDLEQLKGLTGLQSLVLNNTKITDDGLVHLKGLANLKNLHLNDTNVTDAGLVHLQGMPSLEFVSLDNTNVADVGLMHLKAMPCLEWLILENTKITDTGLVHLKELTRLEVLLLGNTKITDLGLENLKDLLNLKTLHLKGTGVTDAGLAHFKRLTNLEYLVLIDTKVTDAGLVHLKGLTKLKSLNLNGTHVTDAGGKDLEAALPESRIHWHERKKKTEKSKRKIPLHSTPQKSLGELKWELIDRTNGNSHYLKVNLEDDMSLAFHEFWKKLFNYASTNDSPDWEIVVVDFRPVDAIFGGYLLSQDWEIDQPHNFDLFSKQISEEIDSMEVDDDDLEDPDELEMIKKKYWDLLIKATEAEDIQVLLSRIREKREIPIWGCEYFDEYPRRLLDI